MKKNYVNEMYTYERGKKMYVIGLFSGSILTIIGMIISFTIIIFGG